VALRPQDPSALVAVSPPESVTLRRSVESGVTSLALGAALISLVLGTISIASATTSSVHSRTGEIGLRAVLGARRRHVFGQILLETGLLGLAGAVAGSVIGLTIVIATATWNGWVPVVDPRFTALAIGGGGLSGLLAGVGPAIRAMRLQPVDALRR
jgi:putative ABC transport system permease protein